MTGHRMSLSHESLFFPSLPLILYNIVIHGRDADHFNSSFLCLSDFPKEVFYERIYRSLYR